LPYPDISTKAKALAFFQVPIEKLEAEKQTFLIEVVPEWDKEA